MTIKVIELDIPHHKSKKTLNELLSSKEIITGKEVIHNLKEQEKRQKEFENSVEEELRNRKIR